MIARHGAHAFHLSTLEAEIGGLLWVLGQPGQLGLHRESLSQNLVNGDVALVVTVNIFYMVKEASVYSWLTENSYKNACLFLLTSVSMLNYIVCT